MTVRIRFQCLPMRTMAVLLMLGLFPPAFGSPDSPDPSEPVEFQAARRRMMELVHADVARNREILGRGELSLEVAGAMARVPRHRFVPPELAPNAYANRPLSIGHGQTISQPTIVALMTDLLAPAPTDTILEIGTGSGYQAAVLAEVVPDGSVHTIEIVPQLARSARKRLAALGYDNIEVHEGDGYRGLPDLAPFAGIIVTAAAKEIPPPLIEQLAPGARLVMPVGDPETTQWLTVLERNRDGTLGRRVVLPVRFVPLTRDGNEVGNEGGPGGR